MKPEVLVAWIETEGTFVLDISKKFNPRLGVIISQVEYGVIHKIQHELGFGEIVLNNSNAYQLRIRRLSELDALFSILEKVNEDDWYTHKLKEFKIAKDFLNWRKEKGKQRFSSEDIKKVIEFRKELSPRATTDLTKLFLSIKKKEEIFNKKINTIEQLRNKNVLVKDIAKEFNNSPQCIYRLIKKYGL